eukprot:TRINITY_DN25072_c0_g1_i1.p1 TRINITY_DN25072_c0_g1~~TRINITY_DN25072_c0_g1_i1.p1  ORF type:complete len:311 (-),score=48.29 TRINITY_DN25072_c0_g1_i1:90-1022(-)
MIPGLPPLPHHMVGNQPHLLPQLLQQAWLSRANTSVSNSFIQSQMNFMQSNMNFPFPNPFLQPPPATSSPEHTPEIYRPKFDEAEDLSAKRIKTEAVCPICNITMRWEDLPDHFDTELKCLDNIRSLSPITRPTSSSSSRPFSASPNKSLSISPSSPGRLENRWQRFERIRNKRRERIGAKLQRHSIKNIIESQPEEQDIDIGDSISDCGSASDSEGNAGPFGPLQYTEADVLRCLSEEDKDEPMDNSEDNANSGISCPTCPEKMSTPVLNVSCWHLKCEKCWLKAVGTKKVCTICSGPASVKELRRVHV